MSARPHFPSCPCPECRRRRAATRLGYSLIAAGAVLMLLGLLLGCNSPVAPAPVPAAAASYDGNAQNSGIIALRPAGAVVTAHLRARYNALIETYGRDFAPPLGPDAGLTPLPAGTWLLDRQHLAHFLQMNAWRRAGRSAAHPRRGHQR